MTEMRLSHVKLYPAIHIASRSAAVSLYPFGPNMTPQPRNVLSQCIRLTCRVRERYTGIFDAYAKVVGDLG
jgi:hypothetical protein